MKSWFSSLNASFDALPKPFQWLKEVFYTLLACAAIAAFPWFVSDGSYWMALRISLGYGISCLVLCNLTLYFWRAKLGEAASVLIGSFFGIFLGSLNAIWVLYGNLWQALFEHLDDVLSGLVFGAVVSLVMTYHFFNRHKMATITQQLQQQEMARLEQEKALLESNLKVLQSQMEPHFLFNTLATIQSLIDIDSQLAKQVLSRFTDLLRASLQRSRSDKVTLQEEMAIVAAYLDIQKVRMGERLTFQIEMTEAAESAVCPPLVLQPIVENAVVHGLEPWQGNGVLHVQVHIENDLVHVVVEDNGIGFGGTSGQGNGIGLHNIRQRLSSLYGDKARLTIRDAHSDQPANPGVRVDMVWPYQRNDMAIRSSK